MAYDAKTSNPMNAVVRIVAFVCPVIAGSMLCSTMVAQVAPTPPLFFPKGTNLTSFLSIAESSLGSSSQQIMMATLQGLVARASSEQLYIDTSTYSRWRLHLAGAFRVPYTTQSDPWAVLNHFKGLLEGYVLYDYASTNSRNAATSLCGPLNAIAVDVSLEASVRAQGITNLLADVRTLDEAAVRANYPGAFSRRIVVEQEESFRVHLRDYAVMVNAFTFADGNTPFRASVLAGMDLDAALLGWGEGSENMFIGAASDAGVFTVPADFARNLSILSSVRTAPARQRTRREPVTETNVHYVAFLVTDGDNLQWALGDFPDYFNHPARGSFSMGWALPPSLADLAPTALHWFFDNASNGIARDCFVAGPSALGYYYPSRYPTVDLEHHTRRFNDFAAVSDLRIAQIIDFNSFNRLDLWSRYTAEPNIDALIYIEYSRYDARAGALLWQNGKPILTPRKMLWNGLSGADEASVTAALNSAARDPYAANGYSLVMVHVWSKDLSSVQTVVSGLAPQVRVVTPEEMVRLMKTNIAGKHAFDFENGLQGWSGTTSGKPSDRADWLDGALRLTGVDPLADSTPNATFIRPISLPLNTTQLQFETRADAGGLLRVRLRRANGAFVTLADWSALTDQNWQSVTLNIAPYAGEDVSLYFEQNASASEMNETRYVDNVGIDQLGVASVIEAEADTYVQNGASSFANFGSSMLLSTGTGADVQEAFLRFALTNVSGRVLEARLRLTPRTVSGVANNALAMVPDNSWNEMTMTWDNRSASLSALTNWIPTPSVPVELIVSDAVQSALTNGLPISFRVYAPDAAPMVSYASREDHALYSPRLTVITSNTPPSVSMLSDQTVARNSSTTLSFTVGDAETPVHLLDVSAASSNTNLVPISNITFDGTAANRSITLTTAPNQLGTTTILVTVSDGVLSGTTTFVLVVVGSNNPPTLVQFTSPLNNAVFNAPAAIPLAASVTDPDGNIARVDYFLGTALIGSAVVPPYSLVWSNVPVGNYVLRAVATDDGGLSVTSAVRQVRVANAPVTLVSDGAVWKYYDVNGVDLGTAWRATNYNDSAWPSGPAKLGFGDPATTQVNSDPTRVTTYFRHRFLATNVASITSLTIAVLRDDGAVVYLNGAEVFRSNMPGGTILNSTLALSAISGAEETTWFTNTTASPSLLVQGTNVIAVEVHQGSASSSDLGFNGQLVAQRATAPVSPVTLNVLGTSSNLVLSWPATNGWNLYASPILGPAGVWTRISTGATTANGQTMISVSPTQSSLFFQLRQP